MPAAKSATETDTDAVKAIAQDLFTERSARAFGRDMKQIARQCFRDAEAFFSASQLYELGELETAKPAGPKVSGIRCPNLPKTHPHNLVAMNGGDLGKARKILEWLRANPKAETYESDDGSIRYDKQATELARILFPEYIVDEKLVAAS